MTLEVGLRTFLLEDAAIAALVGSGAAARLFPVKLRQGTKFPAISYRGVSRTGIHSHDGPSGLAWRRLQIDCYAETFVKARALCDAVRLRLEGYRGAVGSEQVQRATLDTERDLHSDDVEVYWILQDWEIWYEHAT